MYIQTNQYQKRLQVATFCLTSEPRSVKGLYLKLDQAAKSSLQELDEEKRHVNLHDHEFEGKAFLIFHISCLFCP